MGIGDQLLAVWPAVTATPVTAIAALLLLAGVLMAGFAAGRVAKSERIDTLKERIVQKDETIAALEKQIAVLEKQVGAASVLGSEDGKQIRQTLAEFMSEGEILQRRCVVEDVSVPKSEINAWVMRVHGYLRERLDESYATRLLSDSIADAMGPLGKLTDEQRRSWRSLRTRLLWLSRFVQEFS